MDDKTAQVHDILRMVSAWCREICDVWMSREHSPPQAMLAMQRYSELTSRIENPVKHLESLRQKIDRPLSPHVSLVLRNVDARIEQFRKWSEDMEGYEQFQKDNYEKYARDIYQLDKQDFKRLDEENQSMHPVSAPQDIFNISKDEYLKELFTFGKSLFSQAGVIPREDFFDIEVVFVDWALGTYREKEKRIFIGESLDRRKTHFFQVLAHEFGHHVHYKLTKALRGGNNVDEKLIHSQFIDFAIVASEGFAIVFVEEFARHIKDKWSRLSEALLEQNRFYLQYTVRRASIGREYSKGMISREAALDALKLITHEPLMQMNSIVANPAYKEVYFIGYLHVKKMGLVNLAKMGFIGLEELKSINIRKF